MAGENQTRPFAFDPGKLIELQRRNLEAFMSAGEIVSGAMRAVAERQVMMMRDAMSLMSEEWHKATQVPSSPQAASGEHFERVRATFEDVMRQFQDMSSLLMKSQAEAINVMNHCAKMNMEPFAQVAPGLVQMQETSREALRAAAAQVSSALSDLQARTAELRSLAARAQPQPPSAPAGRPSSSGGRGRK